MASSAFVFGTALKQKRLAGSLGLSLARESRYGVGAFMRPGVVGSLDAASIASRTRAPAFEAFGATKVRDVWPKLGVGVTSKETAAAVTGLAASVTVRAADPRQAELTKRWASGFAGLQPRTEMPAAKAQIGALSLGKEL